MRIRFIPRNPLLRNSLAAGVVLFTLASMNSANAAFKVLHSFCAQSDCNGGHQPNMLLPDSSDDLYGTTRAGGKTGHGVVFKLVKDPSTGEYKEHILLNFCSNPKCIAGGDTFAPLIQDVNGNLYGVTPFGGKNGTGAIFKMAPITGGYRVTAIHSFCADGCANGWGGSTGLAYAGQADGKPWNGTAPLFGAGEGVGGAIVYELVNNGSSWNYTLIKTLNGGIPAPILADSVGNLYGGVRNGGANGGGQIYRLEHDSWQETVLYDFCARSHCADGSDPLTYMVMDSKGNLFGTTFSGGGCSTHDCGVVFEIRKSTGAYKVLHDFCTTDCTDGNVPISGLAIDSSGALYGTTSEGGSNNAGVVFKLTTAPDYTVLKNFCNPDCSSGNFSQTPVVLSASGFLFGTTSVGGDNGGGVAFRLKP